MFNVFGDVLQRLYIAQHKVISIDNAAAKLHYRVTFWLLLACTCLVCSRQYFGEHIRCILDKAVPSHVVNTFCFFTSTYTVFNDRNGSYFAHPGVGPHSEHERRVYHAYYQWVPFVLFGQALLFYLPHLIWKTYEDGTIRLMADGLQKLYLRAPDDRDRQVAGYHIYSDRTMGRTVENLRRQLQIMSRFRLNRHWGVMMVLSEFLNLVNVVVQLRVLEKFLGGNFWNLGLRILSPDPNENPFEAVFPKVTKCDFHKYGPTGTIQVHDAMCVMALNIINEKIYTVLWFWFILLVPISVLALVWRTITYVMHSRCQWFNSYLLKETTGTKLNSINVAVVTNQSCFSDWLLLYYLGSNMDVPVFEALLQNLAADMAERRPTPNLPVRS